ncbi:MAG: ABC transporter ATP-binding protein [Gemmatimonadetes bacterium]|nr:ABC transporter ATP-binding protein [Gemmatimonadota bacterium]
MTAAVPHEEEYRSRFDFAIWKRLFAFTRPYRKDVRWLITFAIGTASVDATLPLLTRRVVDDVVRLGSAIRPLPYVLAYVALATMLALCVMRFIVHAGRIRTHVSHDIREAGFENLQRLSFSFFDQRPVGWLMARMTSDCERLSNILAWGVLDLFWGTTLMTGVSVAMLLLDWRLALLVLAVVPVLAVVSAMFQTRILGTARIVRKTNSRITAAFNESIMGVRTTKVFARERENLGEFRVLTDEMFSASVRNALLSALYLPLVISIGSVAAAAALAVGGHAVAVGTITVGTLIAFLSYARQFFDPIQEMAHWFAEMQMAQASAERVMGLVDAVPEIRDSPEVRARIAAHAASGSSDPQLAADGLPDLISSLTFENVEFRYQDGETVLTDFDLEVRKGQTIALVGPTGGGKTTIISLLCRFYEPTRGAVRADGVDLRERSLGWLQSQLGVVLQQPHLFSGTILENIRYGRLDASAEEIEAAARTVDAHDFVVALPDGYATQVGEGGSRLSTGQKQLISFARAVLADPQILVMDEATSSIDTETEQRIQRGLARVLAGRTSFVIAHRLSTIRRADRILLIDGGRIVEDGTHQALLARRGRYFELYTRQSLEESGRRENDWDATDPGLAPA